MAIKILAYCYWCNKAVKILTDFRAIWIPKSIIANLGDIEMYNTEDIRMKV